MLFLALSGSIVHFTQRPFSFQKLNFPRLYAPNSDDYPHRKAVEFNPAPFSFLSLFNLTEDNADTVAQPATSCLFHRRISPKGKREEGTRRISTADISIVADQLVDGVSR
jgi:hypothetical protein